MKKVESIGEIVREVKKIVKAKSRILWFRGHRKEEWDVKPKIWRGDNKKRERDFTNRFYTRAGIRYHQKPDYDDLAEWLSLMQHYGLPTRLLDWTRSPLIALYFALEKYIYQNDTATSDACIWILEPHKLNENEGLDPVVTPSIESKMCRDMLEPAFTNNSEENKKVLAVMAVETDMRMFIQQGCFTIHSCQTSLNKRNGHEEYLTKLTIPHEAISDLAFDIDLCGFRKGDIFPDLKHLADEFKGR